MIRRVGSRLLMAAAFMSPLDSLRVGPLGGVADLLFLLAASVLIIRFLVAGRVVRVNPYIRVVLAAGLFAVAGLIGTLFSLSAGASLVNIARFSTTTIGLPLAIAALTPDRAEVRRLAWVYILGCTLSSLVSFTTINPVIGRSSGLASHPNVLGLSSALAVPLVLGLWDGASPRGRRLAIACGLVLFGGISRSGSRAAILALVAGLVVYLVAARGYRALGYATAAACLMVASLASGFYTPAENSALDRVLHSSASTEEANAGREELAATVIARVDDNLLTGSGFASATQAHNVYLQVLDIGGLLGVVAFAALAAAILRAGVRGRRDRLVLGSLAAYAGYLVSGLVANSLWDRWLWFPIVIGLAARAAPVASVFRPRARPALAAMGRGRPGETSRRPVTSTVTAPPTSPGSDPPPVNGSSATNP